MVTTAVLPEDGLSKVPDDPEEQDELEQLRDATPPLA